MSHAIRKRQNIDQINQILRDHPEGLTRSQLADRIGVNRATITKYLDGNDLPFVYEDGTKLKLDREGNLIKLTFDLDEITMLHVATRLLARQTNRHNPHAASALRKLSRVVQRADENISRHISTAADVVDSERQVRDIEYLDVLRKLTEARTRGFKIHVQYELDGGALVPYTFSPYFIEPYAPGLTTHVIGWREPPGALRTFKVERLRQAEMTVERFEIPADFDPEKLLAHAWGIWYTDEEPVEVELKFSARVRRRVKETRWHRNEQQPEDLSDGRVRWRCLVAEPREMLPWIRGWGSDVEVIKPEALREELVAESRRLARMYDVMVEPPLAKHWMLWAKTDNGIQYHPLLCHLVDVGHVAQAIWRHVLTATSRTAMAEMFGVSEEETEHLIAFICAAHDIGKASPNFQMQSKERKTHLEEAQFPFPPHRQPCRHEVISRVILADPGHGALFLQSPTQWTHLTSQRVAEIISGHHGTWQAATPVKPEQIGDGIWYKVRAELYAELCHVFKPPVVTQLRAENVTALLANLSGLIAVADWIGSRVDCFPFASDTSGEVNLHLNKYVQNSEKQSYEALAKLHWLDWEPPSNPMSFEEQFNVEEPRWMQKRVIELAAQQALTADTSQTPQPSIVIIEDATGSGKTEAALYLADHWAALLKHRGAYVAMPTMATSNAMYRRYATVLQRRYPFRPNLQLAHSQAIWQDEELVEMHTIGDGEDNGGEDTAQVENWFASRKRTLLATFGVGTVDQALMSVLQTKHFFVRLLALANKTVIFDEVHAYDAHMSTLFQFTLAWLRALGSSVVILSATLSRQTRQKLLSAYLGRDDIVVNNKGFPSLIWASGNQPPKVIETESTHNQSIKLEYIGQNYADVTECLRKELRNGGCAVVICNRVGRAQDLYRAMKVLLNTEIAEGWICPNDLILFHARFPGDDRRRIEDTVLRKFGKPVDKEGTDSPDRPHRAILIATQVVEQSLDLDFDVMISDIAPIDLLIQRVGRLWRHERKYRPVSKPVLWLVQPEQIDVVPKFGKDALVYRPYTLLRTWLELRHRVDATLILPGDTRDLVESVYGSEEEMPDASAFLVEQQAALRKQWDALRNAVIDSQYRARRQLIPAPAVAAEQLLSFNIDARDEDDPSIHDYWRIATRDVLPSVSIICLHRVNNSLAMDAQGKLPVDNTFFRKPNREAVGKLMRRMVTVTHPRVVDFFASPEKSGDVEALVWPVGWRKHGTLRNCRLAIFTNGLFKLPSTTMVLKLDDETGLEVTSTQ